MFLLLWISNKFYSKCFHSSVFEVVRFQVPFSALEKSIGIHNGRSGRHSPCTINLRYEYLLICKIITENLLANMPTFFVQKYQIWSCLLVQDLQPVPQFWLENSKSFSCDLTMYTFPITPFDFGILWNTLWGSLIGENKKLEKVGYCYRVEKVSAIMYKNTINWKTSRDRNS